MRKMKLMGMTLCVLLIAPAFSGTLGDMGKEMNGNTSFQSPQWSDWPMFHHNAQRTGVASGAGIITNATTLRWTYPPLSQPPIGAVYGSPVVGSDGTVYFGSTDRNLYAINPDGTLKWQFTTTPDGKITSSPALLPSTSISIYTGRVYIGTHEQDPSLPNFFAIDAATGNEIWNLQVPNGNPYAIMAGSSPLAVTDPINGEPVIYIGAADGYLYCIRDRGVNGEVVWGTQLQPANLFLGFYSSPAESMDGPMGVLWTIYCGGVETRASDPHFNEGKLFALNPYSGSIIWSIVLATTAGEGVSSPSVGIIEGVETIIAGTSDRQMRAIAVVGGAPVLAAGNYGTTAGIVSCPAIYDLNGDGKVEAIFGDGSGKVHAVTYDHSLPMGQRWDPTSRGSWTLQTACMTIGSSAAVALAGQTTVFIGGCLPSGIVHSINWDGTLKGSYTIQAPELCVASSPAIAQPETDLLGAPGWVFIGSVNSPVNPSEGRLYAFGPTMKKEFIKGIFSTFRIRYDVVELYIRVNKEAYSNKIYDIEILPEDQQPKWDSVEAIEAPEGWSFEKVGSGVRFYTETNPLLICQGVKFTFRVKAERTSWYMRIHVTDQTHQSMGMIVSTRPWLYYFYLM